MKAINCFKIELFGIYQKLKKTIHIVLDYFIDYRSQEETIFLLKNLKSLKFGYIESSNI